MKFSFNNDKFKWHRHFAWLPRRVGTYDWVWLEYIERRACMAKGSFVEGLIFYVYRRQEGAPIFSDYGAYFTPDDVRLSPN